MTVNAEGRAFAFSVLELAAAGERFGGVTVAEVSAIPGPGTSALGPCGLGMLPIARRRRRWSASLPGFQGPPLGGVDRGQGGASPLALGSGGMEPLEIAVVDITRLIASCRALGGLDLDSVGRKAFARRRQVRAELRLAAGAYLKTLARAPDGVVDEAELLKCRLSAEERMPAAIAWASELANVMDQSAGSLSGMAAARNDLWRLSRVAIHLREGASSLRHLTSKADQQSARKIAKQLQRMFRRALLAYAKAAMKGRVDSRTWVRRAREAATARLSS
ncbi:MAG: hypothetical protein JO090_15580, partial [Rhizobacter sp.]|nr:hypothetical protein [Rhizobacter sp.]